MLIRVVSFLDVVVNVDNDVFLARSYFKKVGVLIHGK